MAAVNISTNLVASNNMEVSSWGSKFQNPETGLAGLSQGVGKDGLLSAGFKGESLASLSQILEDVHIPGLLHSSSVFKASNIGPILPHATISVVLSISSYTFKDSCQYTGLIPIIQDTTLFSDGLSSNPNFIWNINFPLPCNLTPWQV